jgi:diguanylate cyclase (GGDEF)-like protein/PAS domain S-box-containing protein
VSVFQDDKLAELLEAMPDAIVMAEPSGCIVLANAQAAAIFEYRRDELVGQPLAVLLPDTHRRAHAARWAEFLSNPHPRLPSAPFELDGRRRNGDEFPLEIRFSSIKTPAGQYVLSTMRDITEHHRAAHAISVSEAGLRQAQLLARLGHVVTGADGVFESWSESLPELAGLPAKAFPRSTREWIEFIHPEDRDRFRRCAIESARTGRRNEVEYRFRRAGGWVHMRQVLNPLPGDKARGGSPTRWFNTLQDVSEQKLAELRIRTQNRMLSVLSSINALIVRATDTDELLQESCRIAVDSGGFSVVWIGLVEDERRCIRLAAGYGGPAAYYERLRAHLAQVSLDGTGRVARIVRERQPIVVDDIELSPAALEHALATGSRSLAALPLVIDGRAVGILVLHMPTTGFFNNEEELKLLRELAADIAFALDHLHKANQIRYLANYDGLTGLPNRGLFSDRLAEAFRTHDPRESILAVAFLDLERFRRVNETLGRGAGDELLKQAATRLSAVNSSAARIGVDIFAIQIRDKRSPHEVARAIEDIAASCFSEPFDLGGGELRIGCRGGVAVYPTDGTDTETLLGNAEAALRKAKNTAERFVFYGPELNARAAIALNLESRLRRAIEHQEFVLHYQPKINLKDQRICGVEALLRWQDPERGIVMPGEFISVLEESGLIGIAGEWALKQALADQARWRDDGIAPPHVAVNVSPLQLRQPDFRKVVVDALTAAGNDCGLELEITESMIMENIDRNVLTLKQLRSAGVSIAIDDFGTGYCSLAYIAKLPVTSLKIDRSFVIEMTQGPEGLAIVSSIIALAHSLKLSVVAEGVETEEQARLLNLLGCDEAQGFLYSRPVPAIVLEDLLRDGRVSSPPRESRRRQTPAAGRLSAAK